MLFTLLLVAAGQDDSLEERVRAGVQSFSSDDPEVRARAVLTLKALGPPALPLLHAILKEPWDPETHARIRTVVKEVRVGQGDALLGEGRLREGLLARAAAENPADPEGELKKRIDLARKDLLAEIEEPGDAVLQRKSLSGGALREKHGPWGLSAVLDLLHPERLNRPQHAFQLLKSWSGEPILIPILGAALKDDNEQFIFGLCEMLLFFGRGTPDVLKGLAALERDPARSEKVRSMARVSLLELGGKPEKP
jgi:hypothetical protein